MTDRSRILEAARWSAPAFAVAIAMAGAPASPARSAGPAWSAAPAAGATWVTQTSPTELTLVGVDFVDPSYGWVVGGEGRNNELCVILRTRDGGDHWASLDCPVAARLEAVSFADRQRGWAVGYQGAAIYTGDGGDSWSRLDTGTTNRLTSVDYADDGVAWITVANADYLLKVHGFGAAPTRVPLAKKQDLSVVRCLDYSHCWALGGDGVMLATADGGATWSSVDFGGNERMYAVSFADVDHGWIAGAYMRATADGGRTWRRLPTPENTVQEMVFFDARQGYAIGDEGLIIHTTDGGETWERQQRELTRRALWDLAAAGPEWLWAVGVKGIILRGHDAGAAVGPTRTSTPPPSPTRTPTATATSTPVPTPTPTGPWVRLGDSARPLLVSPGASVDVVIAWGNMPATVALTGEVTGPVTFGDGARTMDVTLARSTGAGTYPVAIRADAGSVPGERFSVQITLGGTPAGRSGTIAHAVWLPRAGRAR